MGSGIWTMMPATRESPGGPQRRADVGLAGIRALDQAILDGPRGGNRRGSCGGTRRRRVPADHTTARPACTRIPRGTRRVGRDPLANRAGDGPAAQESRAGLGQDHLRPAGRAADRGPRAAYRLARPVGETLDLVGQCLRALVEVTGRGLVAQRWEVDVHIRGGRTAGRHGHQAGNLEVRSAFALQRPASDSARRTTSRHASTVRNGAMVAAWAASRIAAPMAAFSSSVSRGTSSPCRTPRSRRVPRPPGRGTGRRARGPPAPSPRAGRRARRNFGRPSETP